MHGEQHRVGDVGGFRGSAGACAVAC
jgi:hypothetical protein